MPRILQWCVSIVKYDVSHDGDGVLLFPLSLLIPRDGNSWDSELSTACSQAKVLSSVPPLKATSQVFHSGAVISIRGLLA